MPSITHQALLRPLGEVVPGALQVSYLSTLVIPTFSKQRDTFVDFLASATSSCCIYTNHKKIRWTVLDLIGFAWIRVKIADSFEPLILNCIRLLTHLAFGFSSDLRFRWPDCGRQFLCVREGETALMPKSLKSDL
ncbi:hypothetical protein [Burkholderia cenocepacia]|uniref:hypothetical protein n=1 Tax=Burkholderia cenocepacia TaxID=95486 RepID=UPI001904473D|nr:hypothetical protein [Burkholderia cenocepacia]MBJ9696358.1 hypothetical protein [Burkholderia cenocepacia]